MASTKLQQWTRETLDSRTDDSKASVDEPSAQTSSEKSEARKAARSKAGDEPSDIRYDAYMSLLDHRIRNAWVRFSSSFYEPILLMPSSQLYTLYLIPSNFAAVAKPLYILPTSSNTFVHLSLSYNLREAAEAELLKQSTIIDVKALYRECESAFSALSELLGDDQFFFSGERPGLFDASVFAYTHLLLDERMGWKERRMVDILRGYENLVGHRSRILKDYFPR